MMIPFILKMTCFCHLLSIVLSFSTTLVIEKQYVNDLIGIKITVNGSTPGPVLHLQVGELVEISVINKIYDDVTTVHWHGFFQNETPFSDGIIGVTQCPISNVEGYNVMTYKFFAQNDPGTFWYHGHFDDQYPDGLIGAIIINSPTEKAVLQAEGGHYDLDIDDFVLMVADYYESPAKFLLPVYLSPASGGDEPMPDAFIVNGKLSEKWSIKVSKSMIYRVRVINGAAFSMFNVTVDGMPLKIVEIDGRLVTPFTVSYFVLNVAQRVNFLLDFSKLNSTLKSSPAIWIRFEGMRDMYPTYNETEKHLGLYGNRNAIIMLYVTLLKYLIYTNRQHI